MKTVTPLPSRRQLNRNLVRVLFALCATLAVVAAGTDAQILTPRPAPPDNSARPFKPAAGQYPDGPANENKRRIANYYLIDKTDMERITCADGACKPAAGDKVWDRMLVRVPGDDALKRYLWIADPSRSSQAWPNSG